MNTTSRHRRSKVLFMAEGVTLAHVARPLALSAALAAAGHECLLASDPRYHWLLKDYPGAVLALHSLDSQAFLLALARGRPVYDEATLGHQVEEDLHLLDQTRPDAVVGDFRLSLSVSARLAGVPYLTISNAYWSPYVRQRYPLPEHPLAQRLGLGPAQALFRLARPLVFALHARPLNRVRRRFGLPSLGHDLRRVYTDADHVLYADVPEMYAMAHLPENHHFLGPVLWSPPVPVPDWWNHLPEGRPRVYVTLGSSGQTRILPRVLQALAGLPVTAMVATGGHAPGVALPANVFLADYLPGEAAAARAEVVVCNGGSPTGQQALAAGRPVLGLASNLDQFLHMQAVAACGAGLLLRADAVDVTAIGRGIERLLGSPAHAEAAARLSRIFAAYPARQRFQEVLEQVVPEPVRGGSGNPG